MSVKLALLLALASTALGTFAHPPVPAGLLVIQFALCTGSVGKDFESMCEGLSE